MRNSQKRVGGERERGVNGGRGDIDRTILKVNPFAHKIIKLVSCLRKGEGAKT